MNKESKGIVITRKTAPEIKKVTAELSLEEFAIFEQLSKDTGINKKELAKLLLVEGAKNAQVVDPPAKPKKTKEAKEDVGEVDKTTEDKK